MQQKELHSAPFVFARLMETSKSDSLKDLAEWLDINHGTLRSQKARGSIPYDEIVAKCSSSELVYVLKGNKSFGKTIYDKPMPSPGVNEDSSKAAVPFYRSVKPSAGPGLVPEREDDIVYISLPRKFIYEELYTTPSEIFIKQIDGDSMKGTVDDGDIAIIKRNPRRPFEGVYLIRIGEGEMCKRIEERPGRLRIISDNKKYDSYDVDPNKEDIEILGKFVGRVEKM